MAGEVHEGDVAGVGEVGGDRSGADRLVALAVEVTPVGVRIALRGSAHQRIGRGRLQAIGAHGHAMDARCRGAYGLEAVRAAVVRPEGVPLGKPAQPVRVQLDAAGEVTAHVAPAVLHPYAEPSRRARHGHRWTDCHDAVRPPPGHLDHRRRHHGVLPGARPVHGHPELERVVDEGLGTASRAAAGGVAERQRDRIALTQPAVEHVHRNAAPPGPDVALPLVGGAQLGGTGGRNAGKVGGARLRELRRPPVAGVPPGELDRSAVVDAALACVVGDQPGAGRAGLDRTRGGYLRPAMQIARAHRHPRWPLSPRSG